MSNESRESNLIADGSLGVFSTVAVVLMVMGALWLRDNYHMHQPRYINVTFHDIAQLGDTANVFMDGVRVGEVDHLSWENEHRVIAKLKITKHKVRMPSDSRFTILNNGIVGAKYVEIIVPNRKAGEVEPAEIESGSTVQGEDPVRPELALNNLVLGLSRIDMIKLTNNFDADRVRLVRAADQLAQLATKTMPVVDAALPLESDLKSLTVEATRTSKHLNKVLNNPHISEDLKETMEKAKDTADTVKQTMHELNLTLNDKDLRKDLMDSLDKLHKTTGDLEQTVEQVQKITGDKELRTDIKDILNRANDTMRNVDHMFKSPEYGNDLKQTLTSTKDAIGHLDTAAQQLNQILNQRSPLMHMVFGRPGYIKSIKGKVNLPDKKGDKADKKSDKSSDKSDSPLKKLLNKFADKSADKTDKPTDKTSDKTTVITTDKSTDKTNADSDQNGK